MSTLSEILDVFFVVFVMLQGLGWLRKTFFPSVLDEITKYKNGKLVERAFYLNKKLHQVPGKPALEKFHPNGRIFTKMFYVNGKRKTRDGSPIVFIYANDGVMICRIYNDRSKKRQKKDAPSIEMWKSKDIIDKQIWSYRNKVHRFNGPALVENIDGFTQFSYFINGFRSNETIGWFPDCEDQSERHCSICIENGKEEFVSTHCKHAFHRDCLAEWLLGHDDCPICRASFVVSKDFVNYALTGLDSCIDGLWLRQ